jgi:hypothetical protein
MAFIAAGPSDEKARDSGPEPLACEEKLFGKRRALMVFSCVPAVLFLAFPHPRHETISTAVRRSS